MSDIYEDSCGDLYRGVWSVGYLKQDYKEYTLLAKGRTDHPKEKAEFVNDVEPGPTNALDRSDFLFLTPPFPGDRDAAKKLATQAPSDLVLNPNSHLFEKKN
jgi:hypothetical protein